MTNASRKAELLSSQKAAELNFTTDNILSAGCTVCGCSALIHYHYDNGKPVPNAPFILTDSNNKALEGKTDSNGLCLIEDMGCGAFNMLLDEGDDEFVVPETQINNPVIQDNAEYAAIAGEYFTLFSLLRRKGFIQYDSDDSSENNVDVDDAHFFLNVPDEFEPAYQRFRQLNKQINEGSKALKVAINKIHVSLPAEIVSQAGDNTTILLFCEVAVGFIPVVGQAVDVYDLGQWGWTTYSDESSRDDPWHWAIGSLAVIGFVPGLGDALKRTGNTIITALKASNPKAIQVAMKTLRGLSNGNLVKYLSTFEQHIRKVGKDAIVLLNNIVQGLKNTIANAAQSNSSWIVRLLKDTFDTLVDIMATLSNKLNEMIDWVCQKVAEFIDKIVTKVSGTPRPKGSKRPEVPINAGINSGEQKDLLTQVKVDKANLSQPSKIGVCTNGCPIDMATGNVVDWRTDFTLSGRINLIQQRFYHSAGLMTTGLLGTRWRSLWDMTLTLSGNQASFIDEQYSQADYLLPNEGQSTHAAHLPEWCLTRQNNTLIMKNVSGLRYRFNYAVGDTLLLSHISDGKGNDIHFLYDRGTLKRIVLDDNRIIVVDTHHRRIEKLTLFNSKRDPIQTLAQYVYDAKGQMLSCRAAPGCSFDYQYSEQGYLLRWSDLSHTWVEHDYDTKGRAIASRGADDRFNDKLRYDDENRLVYYMSALNGVKRYYRDERNNIIRIMLPNGNETFNEWHDNQLVAQSNSLGERTAFTYDKWGQIAQVTAPDTSSAQYEYNQEGQLTAYINPLGAKSEYHYDHQGNISSTINPLAQQWFYQYTSLGQLTCVISPDDTQTDYHYNDAGQLITVSPPLGEEVHLRYDHIGRLISRSYGDKDVRFNAKPRHLQRWHYQDSLPYPSSTTHEDGSQSYFNYDVEGNLTRFTNALGHQHNYEYGSFDKLMSSRNPEGALTRYQYNGECQFLGVINSQQEQWRFDYNTSGQIVEERHFDGRRTRFNYDDAGRVSSKIAADGTSLHLYYDEAGRLVQKQSRSDEGCVSVNTHFEYDAASQLIKAQNTHACVEFEYDKLGRQVKETLNGQTMTSQYTPMGHRSHLEYLSLNQATHDAKQHLHQIASEPIAFNWHGGLLQELQIGEHQALQFGHNLQGQEINRSNGLGFHLAQGHNREGLLTSQQLLPTAHHNLEGVDLGRNLAQGNDGRYHLLKRNYQYDALNQISQIDDSHWGNSQFNHNGNGQITQVRRQAPLGSLNHAGKQDDTAQVQQFSYDSEQNLTNSSLMLATDNGKVIDFVQKRLEKQLKYTNAGRVETLGAHTYRYDLNGRVIEKCTRAAGFRPQSVFYQWDEEDQLIEVQLANGDSWQYQYDPFGRRIAKIKRRNTGQGIGNINKPVDTYYLWDGNNLLQQQKCYADGSLASSTQWVYEPDSFKPLAQLTQRYNKPHDSAPTPSAELHYIVTDVVGSARELCSETGEVEWRGEQSLWGEYHKWHLSSRLKAQQRLYLEDAANDPVNCDLRYQGQVFDAETGLYYNRHRYYDPETCQYLSPDPIGMAGGLRPQAYVHNPMAWVDPLGLSGCPEDATGRPFTSYQYSVMHEVRLENGKDFPNVSDRKHFQTSNKKLHEAMINDYDYAASLEKMYPGITAGVVPGSKGAFPRKPPHRDLTWHHNPHEVGLMQLIPTQQHKAKGPVQTSLHPNGYGGMKNWGGGRQ